MATSDEEIEARLARLAEGDSNDEEISELRDIIGDLQEERRQTRFALVRNARDAKQLWAYLPDNYVIVGGDLSTNPARPLYVIAGQDSAGWTMDDYVIPRLASGLIWATELDYEGREVTT